MGRKTAERTRCALCSAKDVTEPRGDERYCRDCWTRRSRSRKSSQGVRAQALHPAQSAESTSCTTRR